MKKYNILFPSKPLSLIKMVENDIYYSLNNIEKGYKFYSSSLLNWPVFSICEASGFDKYGVLTLNTKDQNRYLSSIPKKAYDQNTYEERRNNHRWRIRNAKIL